MFKTARIKLTAWYLGIIMAISVMFSFVIYHNINNEFLRFEKIAVIMQQDRARFNIPLRQFQVPPTRLDLSTIRAARTRLITALGIINLSILGIAGAAGYFLAGRTLKPIKEMVDDQNQFISDASHELRTPLTALKASLEVNLRDKKLTLAQAKAIMKDSISEVNTLQALSDSLLTLAQYQAPNGNTTHQEIELGRATEEAVKKVTPLASEKSITIHTHLTPISVKGNHFSLVDLVVILLDNAIKYSSAGGVVEVTLHKAKGHAELSVKDRGIGIAKKRPASYI